MNKLRKKIFFTIFCILTISILSFIVAFNVQNYLEQKKSIVNSLNVASDNRKKDDSEFLKSDNPPPEKPEEKNDILMNENVRYMDAIIYTVLLDEENNIKDVINHSNNDISNDQIIEIANELLSSNVKNEYVGCLYIEDYSYLYTEYNSLVILDNSLAKERLIHLLYTSIFIFVIAEGLVVIIDKIITNWIVKPVNESFEKQKQFIADASHELKTPVSVILASSEALEENPKEKKWINNIKNESDRMNLLIADLLELASSEHMENIEFVDGNLSKTVELSVLTFEVKAFEKNIKLEYEIEENITFKMNENSIKQLVEILLDNAIKHSYAGENIYVSLKKSGNSIELIVENKGDEIPKGEEEKIFERFYRVDKSRNRKESRYGLGLAIAKNIVQNHNGKISAISNNNITTFKVLFKK